MNSNLRTTGATLREVLPDGGVASAPADGFITAAATVPDGFITAVVTVPFVLFIEYANVTVKPYIMMCCASASEFASSTEFSDTCVTLQFPANHQRVQYNLTTSDGASFTKIVSYTQKYTSVKIPLTVSGSNIPYSNITITPMTASGDLDHAYSNTFQLSAFDNTTPTQSSQLGRLLLNCVSLCTGLLESDGLTVKLALAGIDEVSINAKTSFANIIDQIVVNCKVLTTLDWNENSLINTETAAVITLGKVAAGIAKLITQVSPKYVSNFLTNDQRTVQCQLDVVNTAEAAFKQVVVSAENTQPGKTLKTALAALIVSLQKILNTYKPNPLLVDALDTVDKL